MNRDSYSRFTGDGIDEDGFEDDDGTGDIGQLIADLRGGIPANCDFCNQPMDPETAVAEEAGQWACAECWQKFEAEDAAFNSPTHHRL